MRKLFQKDSFGRCIFPKIEKMVFIFDFYLEEKRFFFVFVFEIKKKESEKKKKIFDVFFI